MTDAPVRLKISLVYMPSGRGGKEVTTWRVWRRAELGRLKKNCTLRTPEELHLLSVAGFAVRDFPLSNWKPAVTTHPLEA